MLKLISLLSMVSRLAWSFVRLAFVLDDIVRIVDVVLGIVGVVYLVSRVVFVKRTVNSCTLMFLTSFHTTYSRRGAPFVRSSCCSLGGGHSPERC